MLALTLRIKKLDPAAVIPESKTAGAAGLDLTVIQGTFLRPGQTMVLATGLAVEIPQGYVGLIRPRSSAYAKKGLDVNGTIDADYRGPVGIMLRNSSNETIDIKPFERYAQMIIVPAPSVQVFEVSELTSTERGEGGFGSTGK